MKGVHMMFGSTFGNIFKITTWGESHGKAIGVVVDGCPAGLSLSEEDIQAFLNRRKPGQSIYSTPRKEDDSVEILSGTFEGMTTGTPISLIVHNKTARSSDYSEIASYYRPGHADLTFDKKFGFRDYRGGGRSSGRETIGRVAAGAIAAKILEVLGIHVCAYTRSIGPVKISEEGFDLAERLNNPMYMPDVKASLDAMELVNRCRMSQDSIGGIIECRITGVPAGLGDPVFEKYDALLAKAVMSIGSVKGFEVGDGFDAAKAKGSENNDPFVLDKEGKIAKASNHSGGILGGMSDGSMVLFRAAVKPTPSISSLQETVSQSGQEIQVQIKGRHDPIIVPRAVVVVESMAALVTVDLLLGNMASRMDRIADFYKRI